MSVEDKYMSRSTTKPTKWHVRPAKTLVSLGIHPVWSESSLSAWRSLRSLATHWTHSEDWSDWADAQADLSLNWAQRSLFWFCRVAALTKFMGQGIAKPTKRVTSKVSDQTAHPLSLISTRWSFVSSAIHTPEHQVKTKGLKCSLDVFHFFLVHIFELRHDKTCLREFPTRPDSNRPVQPQKLARVLKFRL